MNTNNKITQQQVAEYIHRRGGYVKIEDVAKGLNSTNAKIRMHINNMQRSNSYIVHKKPAGDKTCAFVYKISAIGKVVAKNRLKIEVEYNMPAALKNWLYGFTS